MAPLHRRRLLLAFSALLLLASSPSPARAHNITRILAAHPEFSTFNHYLTATHLASEINRRLTITVLAVDNSAMNELLSKHLSIFTIKNVLSLHVLADYFGTKKLHQITHRSALVATLFQATGTAPGTSGYVNITNFRGGKVGFGAVEDTSVAVGELDSFFVKSVLEIPYKISVVKISKLLSSPVAEAPTPAPSAYNLTELMTKKGCKTFAGLVAGTPAVEKIFESNVDSGVTILCPIDQAFTKFMPKYKNLTADGKESLLLYHGIPVYNSLQMLKSGNGVVNTLATDGTSRNYNFTVQNAGEVITIKTKISTASITGTVIDEQPMAIYTIDRVLEPRELFKHPEVEAPAPAPAAKPKKGKKTAPEPVAEAPSEDDSTPADQTADGNDAGRRAAVGGMWAVAAAVVVAAVGF